MLLTHNSSLWEIPGITAQSQPCNGAEPNSWAGNFPQQKKKKRALFKMCLTERLQLPVGGIDFCCERCSHVESPPRGTRDRNC